MKKTDYLSTLFVGIDIGSRTNVISAIDFDQDYYIHMKSLPNNQDGASRMEEMICGVLDRHHDFNRIVIAMESTSNYGLHIANYLSSSERLAPFSSKVYVVNPKLIRSYKGTFVDLPKNDGVDSFVIADFARAGKIKTKP